jgi:aldehyde:ferredoxin oxidoreductase
MSGYQGRVLRANLSEGSLKSEPLDMTIVRKYLGGKGYATAMIFKKLKKLIDEGNLLKEIDPLGEHNDLIFATGPATGVPRSPGPYR